MHVLVKLAKDAAESYVKEKKVISPPFHCSIPSEVTEKAGVFVSIKKEGQLRGCIGTYCPQTDNVVTEVIVNAINAATRDPRFEPIRQEELAKLTYSVDVLSELEKVDNISDLDPKHYGIVVTKDQRRGLLLPDLNGVDTVEEQIRISKLKAGIEEHEEVEIYRFRVMRYR